MFQSELGQYPFFNSEGAVQYIIHTQVTLCKPVNEHGNLEACFDESYPSINHKTGHHTKC